MEPCHSTAQTSRNPTVMVACTCLAIILEAAARTKDILQAHATYETAFACIACIANLIMETR